MKRLVCTEKGKVGWLEVELPEPRQGQVRVQCEFGVEKHGTMQAFVKGYANERGRWDPDTMLHRPEGVLWGYPVPLGNMQYGSVVQAGPDCVLVKEGDKVAVTAPFQPSVVVSETECWVVPEGTAWQDAMMLDPCEFAMGALRDGKVRLGDRVAVFGLGAIGLACVQLARAAGATWIGALDPLASRREVAANTGADAVFDPTRGDIGLALREATDMRGPDVIIDFSGSPHALQQAIRGVAYGGVIVMGAFPPPHEKGIDFGGEFHMNRPTIVSTRACSDPNPDYPRWSHRRIQQECFELICRGAVRGEPILGPMVSFEELPEAYPRITGDSHIGVKLVVKY